MSLLFFILICYGLTQILVYGSIFNKVRPNKERFGGLFHCPMCMGFWVGVLVFLMNGFTTLFTFDYTFVNALMLGWLSSGSSYVICGLFNDNGFQIGVSNGNDQKMDDSTSS